MVAKYHTTLKSNLGRLGSILMILVMLFSAVGISPAGAASVERPRAAAGSTRVMCENDASLVGCWRMEEGSGSTLNDGGAAPYNNLSSSTPPTFIPGKIGNYAIALNGTSQYAQLFQINRAWILQTKSRLLLGCMLQKLVHNILLEKRQMRSVGGFELALSPRLLTKHLLDLTKSLAVIHTECYLQLLIPLTNGFILLQLMMVLQLFYMLMGPIVLVE